MPTIRISDETMERLKRWAVPLEDTADDAIQRVLEAAESAQDERRLEAKVPSNHASSSTRIIQNAGVKLPQKEFRIPLIVSLYRLGGGATKKQVCQKVYEMIEDQLSEADHQRVKSGEPRWLNAICWERSNLVKEGIFRGTSEWGVWELSERGAKVAEEKLRIAP